MDAQHDDSIDITIKNIQSKLKIEETDCEHRYPRKKVLSYAGLARYRGG